MEYLVNKASDEMYHYGVIGMKWGIRRGRTSQAYSKGVRKLKKYEKKEAKYSRKSDKYALKGMGFTEISRAHQQKSAEYGAKAKGYALKGKKLHGKMEKVFKDVPMSELKQEDIEYFKDYTNKLIKHGR